MTDMIITTIMVNMYAVFGGGECINHCPLFLMNLYFFWELEHFYCGTGGDWIYSIDAIPISQFEGRNSVGKVNVKAIGDANLLQDFPQRRAHHLPLCSLRRLVYYPS